MPDKNAKSTKSKPKKDAAAVYWSALETPIGDVYLASTTEGLLLCCVSGKESFFEQLSTFFEKERWIEEPRANEDAAKKLAEYFSGKRKTFGPHPPLFDMRGATEFERSVWFETQKIPFGTTVSYKELAAKIDKKEASRAVGNALGRNRVPIFIPCHRVLKSDGGLGGFTGGLDIKIKLLELEGVEAKGKK